MKVVINGCFGGFNLSDAAVEECIKRGMKVTAWTPEGNYEDKTADFVDWHTHKTQERCLSGARYSCCNDTSNKFRSNPILVEVVEKLGEKADGFCAKLKVVDIPFRTTEGWHIDEYDGMERICENHESWS